VGQQLREQPLLQPKLELKRRLERPLQKKLDERHYPEKLKYLLLSPKKLLEKELEQKPAHHLNQDLDSVLQSVP
jgi:hypothetical protein